MPKVYGFNPVSAVFLEQAIPFAIQLSSIGCALLYKMYIENIFLGIVGFLQEVTKFYNLLKHFKKSNESNNIF